MSKKSICLPISETFQTISEALWKAFHTYFTISEKKPSALWDGLNQFHKNHTLNSHFTINTGWLHKNHTQHTSIHIRDYFGNTYS